MKFFHFLFLFLIAWTPMVQGQSLEENVTVLFVQANVLYDSGRYDEAVRMYNRILLADENFSMALLMRGRTKYELGAYRGTKNDAITYIEKAGVTKEVIHLMAKTEMKLSNFKASKNYVITALEMDPFDGELYYMAGELAQAIGSTNEACEHFSKGAQLGHHQSVNRMETSCLGYVRLVKKEEIHVESPMDTSSIVPVVYPDPVEELKLEKEDLSATQEIKIDEKLSLSITNGLGKRIIEKSPTIFILSEDSGHVVVDVCVNTEGKVYQASFNRNRSSLQRSSLTSLAIRKSKEFLFIPSLRPVQCGSIIFIIKS